jgi:hypothetical protein
MAVFRLLTIQPPITKSRPVRGNFVSKSRGFAPQGQVRGNRGQNRAGVDLAERVSSAAVAALTRRRLELTVLSAIVESNLFGWLYPEVRVTSECLTRGAA